MKAKKFTTIFLLMIALITTITMTVPTVSAQAATKKYTMTKKVTLTGKIKKVKYLYAGEYQTNYVLYTTKKFKVKDGGTVSSSQNRICLYISKKKYNKYKNKKVKVKGSIEYATGYYCTLYLMYKPSIK